MDTLTTSAPNSLGSGAFAYKVDTDWAKLPHEWRIGEAAGVAVDSRDRVYVFNRGDHPMLVFDKDGNLIRSWGEGVFTRPHGLRMAPDDTILCTDVGDSTVRRYTLDGELVQQLGKAGQATPFMSNRPFNKPTDAAVSPVTGEIFVCDGYGNACIQKFSPDGKHLATFGEGPGRRMEEYLTPHNIVIDEDGYIYITERENHRVKVIDHDGKYIAHWSSLHRPNALSMHKGGRKLFYVSEVSSESELMAKYPNIGPRINVMTEEGEIIARIGEGGPGPGLTQFVAPHGLGIDSRGDIFVGECSIQGWDHLMHQERPPFIRTFRKLVKI